MRPTCPIVYAAGEEIAKAMQGFTVIVTKSTVPVGTAAKLREIISKARPDGDFEVASNPEFMREGSAVEDFLRPDRVVVGVNSERAEKVLRQLYRPLTAKNVPLLVTSCEAAEIIKYAANTFLATRIAFVNQLADLCEKVGADIEDVARGMGLDKRIGLQFLSPGPGFGGSCFPKDTRALVHTARQQGNPFTIVENVIAANEQRKRALADRIQQAVGGTLAGKKHRAARHRLQGRDGRHPRCRGPHRHPRTAEARRLGCRLRSGGDGQWPPGLRVGAVVCGCLFGGHRCRCRGDPHRVERVPRPRPQAHGARHAPAGAWSISATCFPIADVKGSGMAYHSIGRRQRDAAGAASKADVIPFKSGTV